MSIVTSTEFTKQSLAALQPGQRLADRVEGLRASCWASGKVTFEYRYRFHGRRKSVPLGPFGTISIDDARKLAMKYAVEVHAGGDPAAKREATRKVETNTVNAVLDDYLAGHVKRKKLRSGDEIKRDLERLVRPVIGETSIYTLTREQMLSLRNSIARKSGDRTGRKVMGYVAKAFKLQAVADGKFNNPIIPELLKDFGLSKRRKRVLDDEEILELWQALAVLDAEPLELRKQGGGIKRGDWFTKMVRTLLLTGQRIGNVSRLHSDEIKDKGANWVIAELEDGRAKLQQEHLVPLSDLAKEQIAGKGYLFSDVDDDSEAPTNKRFSKPMRRLRAIIAERRKRDGRKPMPHWTFHDLRRTARTLMSRYTSKDIAERAVGHKMPVIQDTYDRYEYVVEKRAALNALASHISDVINPGSGGNVVRFKRKQNVA